VSDGRKRAAPKVLHIVENLDNGAVENWLIRMLRAGRDEGASLDWTFFCILEEPGRFDAAVRKLGAIVQHSAAPLHNKLRFALELRAFIAKGRYDVVHCHHDIVSAFYLVAMLGLPLRKRIVHVHNADLALPTNSARKAAMLREPMRRLCLRLAHRVVGISKHTLTTFVNGQFSAGRDLVLYSGIDTSAFRSAGSERAILLKSIDLPNDARIMLFAGRLVDVKNPLFVIDVLAEMARKDAKVFAVFAGTGPLAGTVRESASTLGILDRVRILGWRDDTAHLMRASNLFIFPRLEAVSAGVGLEGLGMVVVEAQAAGLPMLLSRGIPEDAIVNDALCQILDLTDGPAAWAERAFELLERTRVSPESALSVVERSPFSISNGLASLLALDTI
jgi:glycosyltransferase involved in cell wall biosynthesis